MGRMSRGVVIAAITVTLAVLVALFVFRPFSPNVIKDGLDDSWVAVMGDAADRHLRWGVDLAFTYGPAMPLVVNFFNGTYFSLTLPLLIGFALLFGFCAAVLVVRLGRTARGIAAGAVAIAVAVVGAKGSADAFYLTLPFLVFLLVIDPEPPSGARRLATLAGAFAMGLTAMAKMSFPLAALPLFLVADAAAVLRRRVPLLLASGVVGLVAGDLLFGQRLSDLPAYLALQGEVVAGYSAAMALPGPAWDLGAYLGLGAALVGVGSWVAWRERGANRWTWLVPFGLAVDLYFLLKAGFVRHDLHALTAWRGLALVAVMAAFGPWLTRHRRVTVAVTGAALVVAFVYAPVLTVRQSGQKPRGAAFARLYGDWLTDGPPEELARALALLRDPAGVRADLEAASAEARAAIAAEYPFGPLPGTVDVVPSIQSRLLAAGLDYDPRPSFQEYSTYTERLVEANRAFLKGPRAPDWILFGLGSNALSIDGRYPNSAEGGIWPDLLRLYRPDHRVGSLEALRRRAEPVRLPFGPARTVTAGFNSEVPIAEKDADAVWATLDAHLNPLGRLAELLFRPPLPGLAVRFDDGTTRRYRFVPALGRAGLILSPLVVDASEFVDLAEGRPADPRRRVVAVWLEASRAAAAFYEPEVRFTFSRIDTSLLHGEGPSSAPTGSAWDRLLSTRSGVGADDGDRLEVPRPSTLWIPARGLDHLTIDYGVDDEAWRDAHTSGICFAILSSEAGGAALWHDCLDPLGRPEDRGPHTVALDVPPGSTEIGLQTGCRGSCGENWAYWAKPDAAAAADGAQ